MLVLSGSLPAQLVVSQPLGIWGEATKGSINPGLALSCSRGGVILAFAKYRHQGMVGSAIVCDMVVVDTRRELAVKEI